MVVGGCISVVRSETVFWWECAVVVSDYCGRLPARRGLPLGQPATAPAAKLPIENKLANEIETEALEQRPRAAAQTILVTVPIRIPRFARDDRA